MVELVIPGRAEYVQVARLAVMGVASRMDFSYDAVEDIRLAVGEAINHNIGQMQRTGREAAIRLKCGVTSDRLVIEVGSDRETIPLAASAAENADADPEGAEVRRALIEALMDEVELTDSGESSGAGYRMVKRRVGLH